MSERNIITFETNDSNILASHLNTHRNLEGSDGSHKANRRYRIYGPFQKWSFNKARRLVIAEILMQREFDLKDE
jgi:hypothetical protein